MKTDSKFQSGIAQILVMAVLLAGIATGTYLIQNKTTWQVNAASAPISGPITPYPTIAPQFYVLPAQLLTKTATFSFWYYGYSPLFRVNTATDATMTKNLFTSFVSGGGSPLVVNSPQRVWNKYRCSRTIYWQVENVDGTVKSPVQSAVVVCPKH